MHRDTGTDQATQHSADATGGACYGVWTEAFERLHHAATTGAPRAEVERLTAAELDELTGLGGWQR